MPVKLTTKNTVGLTPTKEICLQILAKSKHGDGYTIAELGKIIGASGCVISRLMRNYPYKRYFVSSAGHRRTIVYMSKETYETVASGKR